MSGLDRHMHRERRAAQRRSDRPGETQDFERGKAAPDHDAGQGAARHAIEGERRAASLGEAHFGIGCADRRADRGELEDEPDLTRELGRGHRIGRSDRGSLADISQLALALNAAANSNA